MIIALILIPLYGILYFGIKLIIRYKVNSVLTNEDSRKAAKKEINNDASELLQPLGTIYAFIVSLAIPVSTGFAWIDNAIPWLKAILFVGSIIVTILIVVLILNKFKRLSRREELDTLKKQLEEEKALKSSLRMNAE